jgi:hypothetical protein
MFYHLISLVLDSNRNPIIIVLKRDGSFLLSHFTKPTCERSVFSEQGMTVSAVADTLKIDQIV